MIMIRGFVVLLTALAALGAAQGGGGAAPGPAPRGAVLDGFVLGEPPPHLGPHVSDFAYEWGDVAFHSRVWERGPDSSGATRVDMTVAVLRGAKLSDPAALRAFLADYLEEPADTWRPHRSRGRPGFAGHNDAFFLDRPGVAVYARLEKPGAGPGDLPQFMEGVRRDV